MIVIQFTEPLSGATNTVYITTSTKGNVNITDSYGYIANQTLKHAGKIIGNEIPEIHEVYKTESEAKDAVIAYLNSIGQQYEIRNQLTTTVTVFGDAPMPFSFEEETELERFIKRIRSYFNKKMSVINVEAYTKFPLKVSIRERSVTGDKTGHDAFVQACMAEQGISEGENFIKTPIGRIEWKYLDTKIVNPNFADTDRTWYEFTISDYTDNQ